ncbi:MAG: beta-galactosidase [Planctomycetes bacterium]|nr:beta-galactosidase [Planctomycetota bacterium]
MRQAQSLAATLFVFAACLAPTRAQGGAVEYDRNGFRLRGKHELLLAGTFSTYRVPPAEWERRLLLLRRAGLNTIDLYVAWNVHEPEPGSWDFSSARADLERFFTLCEAHGMYVYVRPGPYICNETDGGGLPAWLFVRTSDEALRVPDGRVRVLEADPDFLAPVERYFDRLNEIVRRHQLREDGGCVVLYAIGNEHDWYALFRRIYRLGKSPDVPAFLAALRDIVRADGITVPITTATGNGVTWDGTGDVEGVIPCPNLYDVRPTSSIERRCFDSLDTMHDSSAHEGRYVDMPSLVSETERTATRMARVLHSGMDGVNLFNFAGFPVWGYENGMALDFSLSDGLTPENVFGSLRDLRVSHFGGQIDYRSPISARGQLRDEYYRVRRAAHHFAALSPELAPAGRAERTGPDRTSDTLSVSNPQIGSEEGEGRSVYWLESRGSLFFGLLNQTDRSLETTVTVRGETWPRFTSLVVPSGAGRAGTVPYERWTETLLVHGLPLGENLPRLLYSTSEIFTRFETDARCVLVLSGEPGSEGELALDRIPEGSTVALDLLEGSTLRTEGDRWTWTYRHSPDRVLVLDLPAGRRLVVLITTTAEAERLWKIEDPRGRTWLLSDAAFALGIVPESDDSVRIEAEWDDRLDGQVLVLGPWTPLSVAAGDRTLRGRAIPEAGVWLGGFRESPVFPEVPPLPAGTRLREQLVPGESEPRFDDSGWRRTSGGPESLETLGIYRGHAWYRTRFSLEDVPRSTMTLQVAEAAGIVSGYLNGHFIGTEFPMGRSRLSRHALEMRIPTDHLRAGENVLAFRVQIWGHSNFEIPPVPLVLDLPALQIAYPRGLWGEARLSSPLGLSAVRLDGPWTYEAGLLGERAGFAAAAEPPNAESASFPLDLLAGETVWYRVAFDGRTLPDRRYEAPLVLALEGEGLIGTIFVNGILIGRWISDDESLKTDSGYRGIRGAWVPEGVTPDHLYLPRSILDDTGPNTIAIALESLARPGENGTGAARSRLLSLDVLHASDGFDKSRDGGRIRSLRQALLVAR